MWQGNVTLSDAFVISLTGMLVVMLELVVIALFIVIISKLIRVFHKPKPENDEPVRKRHIKPVTVIDTTNQQNTSSDGEVSLENISEEETAVIMSAVSAESGMELDRIEFKSIKKI